MILRMDNPIKMNANHLSLREDNPIKAKIIANIQNLITTLDSAHPLFSK